MVAAVPTVTDDTADVRVTTWTFGPDAATGRHRHEFDYVVVPVTGGIFTVTDSQGRTSTMEQVAGSAYLGVGRHHPRRRQCDRSAGVLRRGGSAALTRDRRGTRSAAQLRR